MNAFLHKAKMHFDFSTLLIVMWQRKVKLFQNSSESNLVQIQMSCGQRLTPLALKQLCNITFLRSC